MDMIIHRSRATEALLFGVRIAAAGVKSEGGPTSCGPGGRKPQKPLVDTDRGKGMESGVLLLDTSPVGLIIDAAIVALVVVLLVVLAAIFFKLALRLLKG